MGTTRFARCSWAKLRSRSTPKPRPLRAPSSIRLLRLRRLHPAKSEARIYDYVDVNVPMLARMFEKRLRGYRSLGYARGEAPLGFGEIDDDFVLGHDWAETEGDGEDDP